MQVIEAYLTPNDFSRTQRKLACVKGIVCHWVANPMSSAMGNRKFFEDRKLGQTGYGAAHDIIDLNGDLVKCLPYDEEAYQVGSSQPYKAGTGQVYTPRAWDKLNTNSDRSIMPYPNNCTIGVECTHLDWNGLMTPETYETLMFWCADRLMEHNLTIDDLYLHQEIVGWKNCHKWFLDNPNEWIIFKEDVDYIIKNGGTQMIKEMQAQVQFLTAEVQKLKDYNAMPIIPDFAIEAIQLATHKVVGTKPDGTPQTLIDSPDHRAYPIYVMATLMHRLGLF